MKVHKVQMDLSTEHKAAPFDCPGCGIELNRHRGEAGEPKDGDVNVCVYCFAVSKFRSGQVQKLSVEEFNALPEQFRIQIEAAISAARSLPAFAAMRAIRLGRN